MAGELPMYMEDIDLPGAFSGRIIRSPIPCGRLIAIETPRLPPSYWVIRAEDIPGRNVLEDFGLPLLAAQSLSYAGEPAALLVGPDQARLEELAAQCRVIAEEAPPRFPGQDYPPEAVIAQTRLRWGDTEAAFREAKTIVEGTYSTGLQEHWYSEPCGAAVCPEAGGLRVFAATQWPFQVRRAVAAALNVPPAAVIVEPTRIGIHLDGKIWYPALLACYAALGAAAAGKPVKFSLSREEDFRYSPKRNGAEIRLRSALGERGQLLAAEASVRADLGAYGVFTGEILDRTCMGALGPYKHGAVSLDGAAVAANTPPAGPLAGFGLAQGLFAAERHASRIADTLGQDPAEWRKNNWGGKAKIPGMPALDGAALDSLIDIAADMGGYRRKWAAYQLLRTRRREGGGRERGEALRGVGIAAGYQGCGFLYSGSDKGNYGVELTLDKDGSLEIRAGIVSSNLEYRNIWRKIAGDILAVDAGAVRFVTESTDKVPDSGPSALSRNITALTRLVERACGAIRKQRFRDPLPITVRRAYRPVKEENWEGRLVDRNVFAHPGYAAAMVEAAIDPVEYVPCVRGVYLAVDGGKILSEERARRALRLSVIHALSWAAREQLSYVQGVIPQKLIRRYEIPGPEDIVPIHIRFTGSEGGVSKGIGELAFSCVPAAYVQAVSQAADHAFSRIPLTARDIWER